MGACKQYSELISALIDGELSSRKAGKTLKHLSQCHSCRAELHQLEEIRNLIATADNEQIPVTPHFAEKVIEQIRAESIDTRKTPSQFPVSWQLPLIFRPSRLALALATLLIFLGIGYYFFWTGFHKSSPVGEIARPTPKTDLQIEVVNSIDLYLYQHHYHSQGEANFQNLIKAVKY